MFAPVGFVSLQEVDQNLSELADEWRHKNPHADDPISRGIRDPENSWFEDSAWIRGAAYKWWLLNYFFFRHERELYACNANGVALKLAPDFTDRMNVFDGEFDDTVFGWKSIYEHLHDPFVFVETKGYTIDLELGKRWLPQDVWDRIFSIAFQLNSLPVCWKLPEDKKQIDWLQACGLPNFNSTPTGSQSPTAVSKKIIEAWRQDPTLSRKEIKSIVAPNLSVRKFGLAWEKATEEFPDLSKPGRRKRKP